MTELLVRVVAKGDETPIIFAPSAGTTFFSLIKLARALRSDRPVYVIEYTGIDHSVTFADQEELANHIASEIRAVLPSGPYYLGGHCWGGLLASNIAAVLQAESQTVAGLVLMESVAPRQSADAARVAQDDDEIEREYREAKTAIEAMHRLIMAKISRLDSNAAARIRHLADRQIVMGLGYYSPRVPVPMLLVRTATHPSQIFRGWWDIADGDVTEKDIDSDAFSMLDTPRVDRVASWIDDFLVLNDRPKVR
jgi:thioesterase domain-containing protein